MFKAVLKKHLGTVLLGFLITASAIIGSWKFYNADGEDKAHLFHIVLDQLNTKTTDYRMKLRGTQSPSENIAIIAIDERSLESIGQWPWPRSKIGTVIDQLFQYKITALGLDIMYTEPSNSEVPQLLKDFKEKFVSSNDSKQIQEFTEYSKRKAQLTNHDLQLAKVLNKYKQSIVAGSSFHLEKYLYHPYQRFCTNHVYNNEQNEEFTKLDREGYDFFQILDEEKIQHTDDLPTQIQTDLEKNLIGKIDKYDYCSNWLTNDQNNPLINNRLGLALTATGEWKLNTSKIFNSTKYNGFLNVFPDLDGTVRKIPLLVRKGPHILPALALRLAMINLDSDGGQVTLDKNDLRPTYLAVKDLELTNQAEVIYKVPVDSEGFAKINFIGPQSTYPHISIKELLEPNNPFLHVTQIISKNGQKKLTIQRKIKKSDYLKEKTVILGATALGLYDMRVTPFDENYAGVEAHATVLDNILTNSFFRSNTKEPPLMILLLLVLGVTLTLIYANFGALLGLAVAIFSTTSLSLFDFYFLFQKGTIVNISFPIILSLLLYFLLVIYKYFTEERLQKAVRGTFAKYVSPAIVNEVLHHPDNLKLGGRKEHMSVFFSDIRGFTTISETLDPEKLSDLLNLYLTPMTNLVFENNGTLDKYMGDAIMAFFGAPIPSDHHATDSCRCALDNMTRLKQLNIELVEQGFPTIDVGIGINTGDMSVGNMGSQSVRNYTVMGDSVNLAARLEGINKQYGTHIIISEFTEKELPENFIRREIDLVKVKGKVKPVRIFELISEGETSQDMKSKVNHFTNGYKLYHQKQWIEAIEQFQLANSFSDNIINEKKIDPVSELYIKRCQNFQINSPGNDWDGVFTMTTK